MFGNDPGLCLKERDRIMKVNYNISGNVDTKNEMDGEDVGVVSQVI